jgi:hypothetical protein
MKLALAVFAVLSAAGCAGAKADSTATVKDDTVAAPSLAILGTPSVIVHPAPQFAAVQPTADLKFSYSSCAERSWKVKRETKQTFEGTVTLVQIEDAGAFDCFGPTIKRDYTVQISSDVTIDGNYVLVNPSMLASALAE